MKKHLYNSKLSKFKWFVKRFGLKEVFKKPIRVLFSKQIIKRKKDSYFFLNNKKYALFYNEYNTTWDNERCVEVPVINNIINEFLKNKNKKILEIGNVLSNYFKKQWDILDKYEKGFGVINKDILNFNPNVKYDLIVSISTLEHIGFDDFPFDSGEKILKSIEYIRKSLLNRGGCLCLRFQLTITPT